MGEEGIFSLTLMDRGGWTYNIQHQTDDTDDHLLVTYVHSLGEEAQTQGLNSEEQSKKQTLWGKAFVVNKRVRWPSVATAFFE